MLTHCRGTPALHQRAPSTAGFTLLEIVLVLVLGALVLGLVFGIGSRLQRQLGTHATSLAVAERLGAAAQLLPMDLRSLSPGLDDLRAGEARDSAFEVRAPVASAIVCSGSVNTLLLAPFLAGSGRRAPPILAGDTLWMLTDSDTVERWRPVQVRGVRDVIAPCGFLGDRLARSVFDLDRLMTADVADSVAPPSGTVVRATRPIRYSMYQGGDRHWYLGVRTWNAAAREFNAIQPLVGPFAAPRSSIEGTRFRYYDSADNPLPSGTPDTKRVARIEATLLEESVSGAADSVRIVVALRNR